MSISVLIIIIRKNTSNSQNVDNNIGTTNFHINTNNNSKQIRKKNQKITTMIFIVQTVTLRTKTCNNSTDTTTSTSITAIPTTIRRRITIFWVVL